MPQLAWLPTRLGHSQPIWSSKMARYAIIDDTDPRVVYTGNWDLLKTPTNPNSHEYNGTVHATNDPSATVSFNFTSSSFSLHFTTLLC